MTRVFYSDAYVRAGYHFDTTRKSGWIAESLARTPIEGIELIEPTPLSVEQVLAVHDPVYVNAVRTGVPRALAESQGFDWDENVWPMVLSSNGGAVAGALAALEDGVAGSLSSGLHHARRSQGAGFCTLNGLVIAAREALAAGARSVLILDFDAHCGGGTASLIESESRISQIDVAVNSFDQYSSNDQAQLEIVHRAEDYITTIEKALGRVGTDAYDLVIYNAGMDPYEGSATGGMRGITRAILAERERMAFERCRDASIPIAFVLAGGYVGAELDEGGLVDLHRLTLAEAAIVKLPGRPF